MSLNDPFFIKFDGSPDLGRVPVRLTVNGTGALTPNQMLGVEHVYHQFRSTYRLSASDFHTERVVLADGTVVWLWSLQGRDEVTVWPGGEDEGTRLPHGFAVATNWQGPLIYCRDLNDGVQWLLGPPAPQISDHTTTNYDNQVFRKDVESGEFFNLPHVRDNSSLVLWDYKINGSPYTSTTPVVPFLLKNATTDTFSFESPHYAVEGRLIDADGTTRYTMEDAPIILLPTAPEYPESVHYWPGQTDADGNQIALQQWRYAVISMMANIWKFRICNERITRVSDTEYAALDRALTEVITPVGKQTVTSTSISDGSLGEEIDDRLYAYYDLLGPGGVGGAGVFPGDPVTYYWFTGWFTTNVDISGVPRRNSFETAQRRVINQSNGSSRLDGIIAVGQHNSVGRINLVLELNYPATVLWRGGQKATGYYTADVFGDSFSQPGWALNRIQIDRKDTKYYVDGTPKITAELGWKNLKLLEGTTTGRMDGRVHAEATDHRGKFTHNVNYVTHGTYSGLSGNALKAWLETNNVRWTEYQDLMDLYWTADFGGSNPPQRNTTIHNERPTNTVSYNLTSRYVIDYDHKGRFYAAIRCEVSCSGAAWSEDISVYEGYMKKDTDPSYTVKIWFECNWGGEPFGPPATGVSELLLAEETITRPGFEIIEVSMFSPWYWPFPAYIDRDCKVRVPPEPRPDENFMMMLNNLASHQGVNPNLCCADVRPDITGIDIEKSYSKDGVEYSYEENGIVTPHTKYVTGQLYARTFKLSDFYEAFWMLYQLKVNAAEGDVQDEPEAYPKWFYHPVIKAAMDVTRHIEVRDGVIVQWSDNIPTPISGHPPTPEPHPAPTDRIIKLYRV